jgi:glycosyltransferase involved in cell wall biosynthesis
MSTADKPRILFVLRYHVLTATGGAEVKAWALATELAKRGWDVHYASEMSHVPLPNPCEGVTLHGLPEKPSYWTGNRLPLLKLMRELDPDVVYNRVFDFYTRHAMEEAPPRALTVWAVASDQDAHIGQTMLNLWRTTPAVLFLKRWPVHLFWALSAMHGARQAKLVISQYRSQHDHLQKRGIESVILPNSHEPVPESEVQSHEGTPMLLWVGSLKALKQPEIFFELARRLSDMPAEFVLVGSVQQPDYEPILAQAQAELKNFKYLGFVPRHEVGKVFAQAHVHLKTSLYEALPETFVQAWLRGVPVVSLNVDPDNLLKDKGLGICVHSVDEFERELRALLTDRERRRAIGRRARDYALQEYDLDANIKKFEQLLAARGVRLPAR